MTITERLQFAERLPLSAGYISELMDIRDSINDMIGVAMNTLMELNQSVTQSVDESEPYKECGCSGCEERDDCSGMCFGIS